MFIEWNKERKPNNIGSILMHNIVNKLFFYVIKLVFSHIKLLAYSSSLSNNNFLR